MRRSGRKREPLEPRPALGARRGAAVDGDGALDRGALRRDRARVVARIGLLLEGRVVLLVHDDETEPIDGREDGGSRAYDDARRTGRDSLALVTTLRIGQGGVQDRDAVAEPRAEAADGLRREGDLGHENDDSAAALERRRGALEVHLRLAASRRTLEEDVAAAIVERGDDPRDGVALRRCEVLGLELAAERVAGRWAARCPTAGPLVRCDERQGTRGSRAVVVGEPERELHERRRHAVDDGAGVRDRRRPWAPRRPSRRRRPGRVGHRA